MATAIIRAFSCVLLIFFQANAYAAGLADGENGPPPVSYSGDAAALHTQTQFKEYLPSRTLRIRQHDGALVTDRVDSCNYATRVRHPGVTTSTDGLPRPVACWAHRWNSGLQTNY